MNGILEALQQGIAPAFVVAIYLIIVKIIDSRKESVQAKLNSDLVKSINIISNFISDMTINIVNKDKDKCKIAIEDAMCSSGMRLINFVSTTIVNNHIDLNRDTVLANIHNIVNTEYYTIYQTLSLYKIDNRKPSDVMKSEWINEIEDIIINVMYNDNLSKEEKILAFANRINLKFQTYISYVINNTIK